MEEPEFDADGYPTEATLDHIRKWPIKGAADCVAAMDFAGNAWHYPRCWTREDTPEAIDRVEVRYTFSTGGWSGNESILEAIRENHMLHALGAWSWRRGGHYEYKFSVEAQTAEATND